MSATPETGATAGTQNKNLATVGWTLDSSRDNRNITDVMPETAGTLTTLLASAGMPIASWRCQIKYGRQHIFAEIREKLARTAKNSLKR